MFTSLSCSSVHTQLKDFDMEKVPPDQLRIAKDNLDISILDPICLKTISSRLVKGLKKNPKDLLCRNHAVGLSYCS